MRAVLLREYGPPERLEPVELPDPVAGPDEVLIDVELANVTFVETQIRAGRPPAPSMLRDLPVVLGNGVGGTVDGRRVVSSLGGSGGYAERVAVPAGAPIDVPDGVSMADAVALLADGRTALMMLRAAEVRPGETVLVEAAAGGVGSLLLQLARGAGARVVAAAGGDRKVELARSLGADLAVDYTRAGWGEGVREWARHAVDAGAGREGGAGDDLGAVDVVFDGVGGEIARAAFALLRPGGRMASFGMASGEFAGVSEEQAAERGVTLVLGGPPDPERLRALAREALAEAAAGRLRPVIGQTFPLERASEAHAAIEARSTLGKTLLVVREG